MKRRSFLQSIAAAAAAAYPSRAMAAPTVPLSSDQPHFRFVPGAYQNDLCFVRSSYPCSVCNKPCVWSYTAGLYSVREFDPLCARCIADGSLARLLGKERFGFHDSEIESAPKYWEEANHRTPGIPTFNPIEWPVIGGVPLAFIGTGTSADIIANKPAMAAMAVAFRKIGWDETEPSEYALLFKEIDGNRWRAVLDFD